MFISSEVLVYQIEKKIHASQFRNKQCTMMYFYVWSKVSYSNY